MKMGPACEGPGYFSHSLDQNKMSNCSKLAQRKNFGKLKKGNNKT